MYCEGRSASGSGLGGFAARAARASRSRSSNCIFDFLSSKNAKRVCAARRSEKPKAQIARRNGTQPFLSELRLRLSLQPLPLPGVGPSRLHVLRIPSGRSGRSGGRSSAFCGRYNTVGIRRPVPKLSKSWGGGRSVGHYFTSGLNPS